MQNAGPDPKRASALARVWVGAISVSLLAVLAPQVGSYAAASGWSIAASPNSDPGHNNDLVSVTCVDANNCIAAGHYATASGVNQTLIQTNTGKGWTTATSANTSPTQDNFLNSVTCVSAKDCWAAGYSANSTSVDQTLIEQNTGTGWTIVTSPNAGTSASNVLNAVTCVSAKDCWAVGDYVSGTTTQTLVEQNTGTGWAVVTSPNAGTSASNVLNAVTCVSEKDCWAVGHSMSGTTEQTLTEQNTGTGWVVVKSADSAANQANALNGVSCVSASDCWAVGYQTGAGGVEQTLTEQNTGTGWVLVKSANSAANQTNVLNGITCVSASDCWAVGYQANSSSLDQTLIEQDTGSGWAAVSSPNTTPTTTPKTAPAQNNALVGVACVNLNDCWTAGHYANSTADQTLVEDYLVVPVVTGLDTNAGSADGGATVTLTGSGFTGATDVRFGQIDVPASTAYPCPHATGGCFAVKSDTRIVTTTPAHAAGQVHVTVVTAGGTSVPSASDFYAYAPLPSVTGVSPGAGPTAGGTSVTVTGRGFTGTGFTITSLRIGDQQIRSCPGATPCFRIRSATTLTVVTPAMKDGQVHVTVTTPGGTSNTSIADEFAYAPRPSVTHVSPNLGRATGGTTITVSGTHFSGPGFSATSVLIGGARDAHFRVRSATSLTVVLPSHAAGQVNVDVVTPGGTSKSTGADKFGYVPQPTVSDVTPHAGPTAGGTPLTISGSGFAGHGFSATSVHVGGATVTRACPAVPCMQVLNGGAIKLVTPANQTGQLDITVTTLGGTSSTGRRDEFAYAPAPTVTRISPNARRKSSGTAVTVFGTHFSGAGFSAKSVQVGTIKVAHECPATPCFRVLSATSIKLVLPARASGRVDIRVSTPGGISDRSAADQFAYMRPPVAPVAILASPKAKQPYSRGAWWLAGIAGVLVLLYLPRYAMGSGRLGKGLRRGRQRLQRLRGASGSG